MFLARLDKKKIAYFANIKIVNKCIKCVLLNIFFKSLFFSPIDFLRSDQENRIR